MRRIFGILFLGALFMFACQAITQPLNRLPTVFPSPIMETSATPLPTTTPSPTVLPPTATFSPVTPTEAPYSVNFHPDGELYVGDLVSLEIIAPVGQDMNNSEVEISVDLPEPLVFPRQKFSPFGLGNRSQATFTWIWDTQDLAPGEYNFSFSVQPSGPTWTQTVTLQPVEALPADEIGARWAIDESDCCLVYYITHTASERDLPILLNMLDEQADDISRQMQTGFNMPITVTLIPRVLGHGGFTSSEIAVSYLDRNYAGGATEMILRHELAHLLDGQSGGDLRPTLFIEGLAVYLSGGHFKSEPLIPRAAVLLSTDRYLPLSELADDFYNTQHEIGYLEAGALVQFMVETWSGEEFSAFYRDIHPAPDEGNQQTAIDIALRDHFNLSFSTLEQRFIDTLKLQPILPELVEDVNTTVDYYNTVRRYQQMLDPSTYFLTAWILDGKEMRQRGITADYLRHPVAMENLVLETMLQMAGENLRKAKYYEAGQLVSAVNQTLDAINQENAHPFSGSSLALDYQAIVQRITDMGYQPQRILVDGNRVQAWATSLGQPLREFVFVYNGSNWELVAE